MDPEVRIVDRYFQERRNWFTITNRKVGHNKEIDILAFDPKNNQAYHVEVCVLFRPLRLKETIYRSSSNRSRDGLDYFLENKFDHRAVKKGISEILGSDFRPKRMLVVSRIEESEERKIKEVAKIKNLEIISISKFIFELQKAKRGSRDDVVRTIELISKYSNFPL